MKLLNILRVTCLLLASPAALAWHAASAPIEAVPLILPLIAWAFAPMALAVAREIAELLQSGTVKPLAAAIRSLFPAPQTGEPQLTAFA